MTLSRLHTRALRLAALAALFCLLSALWAAPASATSPRWIRQASGTTIDLVDVDFIDANTGWVVGGVASQPHTLLKTTDGGASWTSTVLSMPWLLGGEVQYDQPRAVEFLDANNGWVLGSSTVFRTRNGGVTWESVGGPPTGIAHGGTGFFTTFTAFDFASADAGWLFDDSIDTAFKTTDGGDSWTAQLIVPEGADMYVSGGCFPTASSGWAVGWHRVVRKTTDGGATWTSGAPLLGDKGDNLYTVHFSDVNNGIIVGSDDVVYTTADAGAHWKRCYLPNSKSRWNQSNEGGYSINASTAYVYGHKIFATTNGGVSWSEQWDCSDSPDKKPRCLLDVSFVSPKIGWGVGFNGTIVKRIEGPNIYRTSSKSSFTIKKGKSVTLAATIRSLDGNLLTGIPVTLQTSKNGKTGWKSTYPLTTDLAGAASRTITHGKHGTKYYRWYIPAAAGRYSSWTSAQKVVVR